MEREKVIVAIRRVHDEEEEVTYFDIEIYKTDDNGNVLELIEVLEEDFHDDAKALAEFGLRDAYDVIDVQYVYDGEKPTNKKRTPDFKANFTHYRIDLDDFEEEFRNWLKYEKGWDIHFTFETEGPDDAGVLGHLYFQIDDDLTDSEILYEIQEYYNNNPEDILPYLQEMFDSLDVEYDVNVWTDEIYIFVPIKEKKKNKI